MNALFVFLGGGAGSVLRYLVGLWIGSTAFPWATFAVGNFTFHNPTKLHFGENAMGALAGELKNYGGTKTASGAIQL